MKTVRALTLWAAMAVSPVFLLLPALWAPEVSPIPGEGKSEERGNSSFLAILQWPISKPEIMANEGKDSAPQT